MHQSLFICALRDTHVALPGQKDTDKGRKNDHFWSVRQAANILLS